MKLHTHLIVADGLSDFKGTYKVNNPAILSAWSQSTSAEAPNNQNEMFIWSKVNAETPASVELVVKDHVFEGENPEEVINNILEIVIPMTAKYSTSNNPEKYVDLVDKLRAKYNL